MVSRRPENPRRRALRRAADPRHDRQRLAGRPRSRLAAGMNDHVAKPIDKECLVLCLLGHLGRSGAGRAGNGSGRGRTGRGAGRYRRAFRRQPGADRPGVAALRSGHAGPLRPARTPARRGRCPWQRRDPAYHQGQRFHRWRQRLPAVPASWEQALRRADRCAAWKRSPASASTNCAPCAMPACSACRRCSATCRRSRRAEPRRGGQSRQGFRRTRGSPASAAPVGRITPWALSADTPEARPGLERHPLPVVQYLQASRSRSWALSRA